MYRQPFKGEYQITQKYGELIPGVTVNGKPHTGIDYACPEGTPILASADGVVMAAGWDLSGYGFRVILSHSDGVATLYAHLDSISVDMSQKVVQGQEIGRSGRTGNVYPPDERGNHLHFEARHRWNDYTSHFDPMTLPMMSVDDTIKPKLKGSDEFSEGDFLKVQNDIGVKAFFDLGFSYDHMTYYQKGASFYYTGDTVVRKDNGLTYMRCIPAQFCVWIAVNDGETQLLDK